MREIQQTLNPKTGRLEIVFVDLQKVYPNREDPMSVELSFEELRAKHRGWLEMDWDAIRQAARDQDCRAPKISDAKQPNSAKTILAPKSVKEQSSVRPEPRHDPVESDLSLNDENAPPMIKGTTRATRAIPLKGSIEDELALNDENSPPSQADVEQAKAAKKARKEERANRTRKIRVMEVKEIRGETQTSRSPNELNTDGGSKLTWF